MTRFLHALELLLFLAWNSQSQSPGLLIDNFDASNTLQHWRFSNGAEFTGASGTLSLGPGHAGRGAVLTYQFTCVDQEHCGHYVAAIWKAPDPFEVNPGTALSLWIRLSPEVRLTVRVTDETRQTLQFHANAPTLEHAAPGVWELVVVPITGKAVEHWGGANSGQIQGRIVEIAILADSRYLQPAQGEIAFDEVRLLRTADESFRLDRAAAVIAAPEGRGELRSRLGVNIHFLKDDRALDLARDAGFSFVRMDLLWAKLEKHDGYVFTAFDGLMRSLEVRGMGVLWILAYGHPEHGGKLPKSEEDIAAYSRYAAAVVSHFRGHNARFEVWNEPNEKEFLADPTIYPSLLRKALDSIRRHDAGAAVSTGGTSGFDFPFLNTVLESGSAQTASAIAVHPYRDSGPETLQPDLLLLQGLIQAGSNIPVWDTEWGYSSYPNASAEPGGGHTDVARKRQAVLVLRECLTVWVLGFPLAVLYDLRDDGSNPFDREQNFGLLNQDSSDKPAMKAVRVLMSVTRDHMYSGLIRDVPHGVHAMRLDGAADIVFVVWNENIEIRPKIRFQREQLLSISSAFGEPIVAEGDELLLEETTGPVYVHLKRR